MKARSSGLDFSGTGLCASSPDNFVLLLLVLTVFVTTIPAAFAEQRVYTFRFIHFMLLSSMTNILKKKKKK